MSEFDWNDFNETIWERRPAHLGRTLAPLLNGAEVFRLAVAVADALSQGEPVPIRWCDDGKSSNLLPPTPASGGVLPQRSDRDLAGYSARMSSKLDTFFFQIPMLELFSPELWPRLVQFARNFYPRAGTPGRMAWSDAYFGRYTATPFGVHVDGASNFTFGVDGHKTLYLWEPDFYDARMRGADPHDYEPFLGDAIKLTVGPGETIYWPSRFYHIAVPDGSFSVTMNFAYYAEEPRSAWLQRAWSDLVAESDEKQPPFRGGEPTDLLELCRRAVGRASNGDLERQLLKNVVEHTTRLGFRDGPRLRPPVVYAPGDRVILASCELACVPDGQGAAIVSANGYSTMMADLARARTIVQALTSRQPLVVESDTCELISEMHRWSAVERYWEEETRS